MITGQNKMYFTVRLTRLANYDKPFATYTSTDITPFPYSGRFKVRITGYEFSSDLQVAQAGAYCYDVYSRALRNPLMPVIFRFIPDRPQLAANAPYVRQFTKTGWWEVDLSGGIDLAIATSDFSTRVNAFTFLLHLELERVDVPQHLLQ